MLETYKNASLALLCPRLYDNETDLDAGISIHNSPLSVSGRLKCKKFVDMHRKNFNPKGQFGICSIHFTNDCFTRAIHIKGTSRRLKAGAIHTIWKPKTTVSVSERSLKVLTGVQFAKRLVLKPL